jgi:long-chain acyl-CoA synthetase
MPEADSAFGERLLRRLVAERPDASAIVTPEGHRHTFAELDSAATCVADILRKLRTERRYVVTCVPTSPELVALLFGIWRADLVPVLLNDRYSVAEVSRVIRSMRPDLAIVSSSARADVGAVDLVTRAECHPLPPLEGLEVRQLTYLDTGDAEDEPGGDVMAVLLTGGTTGESKQVALSWAGTVERIETQRRGQYGTGGRPVDGESGAAPSPEKFNLICVPLFHIAGLKSLLFAWMYDRSVVLMARYDPLTFAQLVRDYRVDNLFLMPTMLYDLVEADVDPGLLAHVKYAVVGGQRLPEPVRRRFVELFDVPVLDHYGSTEAGAIAGWSASALQDGSWREDAVGKIYPGVDLQILDEHGAQLAPGSQGEIVVRSRAAHGYVGLTPDESVGNSGWVHTGDVGWVDELRRLYVVGRKKELMKVGGFQVWPSEIELVLRESDLVADAAVVSIPDVRLGERPVAAVVAVESTGVSEGECGRLLIEHCRKSLATYKVPREIRFVASLPRLATGKMSTADIRGLFDEH